MESFIDPQEWVPIHTLPGFEACIEYYVSRKGMVKSTKQRKDRILKHKITRNGYPIVGLTQRIGKGKTLWVQVNKLVALAFLPPPPTPHGRGKGCSILEMINGDRLNCSADNLQWVSQKECKRVKNKSLKIEKSDN